MGPLTWDNVEQVLNELRPYLRSHDGDCEIVEIDGPVVSLELKGSCVGCSSSTVTMKMGIERTLVARIPEIKEVVSLAPSQETLSEEGIEHVLTDIRPLLGICGGSITLKEYATDGVPHVVLEVTGPPAKSMAVRV